MSARESNAGPTFRSGASAVATVDYAQGARLDGRVVLRDDIGDRTHEAMFRLLSGHFEGVDRKTFESDLAEKQCAILLEDDNGELRGFSTMALYSTEAAGRPISVVYSGDTIVDRGWWGSAALPRTWIRAVRQLAAGTGELYWLLLTSGYRTYRFLPVFFRTFFPRYDLAPDLKVGPTADTAPDLKVGPTKAMLDAIARERFGGLYDPASGIVRFGKPQVLTPDLLELPAGRTIDPHIAYFLERNPGHVRGDELACLTEISDGNLTPAGRRMARHEGGL